MCLSCENIWNKLINIPQSVEKFVTQFSQVDKKYTLFDVLPVLFWPVSVRILCTRGMCIIMDYTLLVYRLIDVNQSSSTLLKILFDPMQKPDFWEKNVGMTKK